MKMKKVLSINSRITLKLDNIWIWNFWRLRKLQYDFWFKKLYLDNGSFNAFFGWYQVYSQRPFNKHTNLFQCFYCCIEQGNTVWVEAYFTLFFCIIVIDRFKEKEVIQDNCSDANIPQILLKKILNVRENPCEIKLEHLSNGIYKK